MSEAGRERAGAPGPEHQNRFWIITQTAILAREDSPTSGMEDYICCHPDYYWRTLILSSQLLLMTRLVRMATMLGMRLHWKLIPGPGSLVRLITAGVTVSHHTSQPHSWLLPAVRVVTSIWLGLSKKCWKLSHYRHFSSFRPYFPGSQTSKSTARLFWKY